MHSGYHPSDTRRDERAPPGDRTPSHDDPSAEHAVDVVDADAAERRSPRRRTEEWRSFVFFTVVMAPLLAVLGVSGYGFLVWMFQTFVTGPPG